MKNQKSNIPQVGIALLTKSELQMISGGARWDGPGDNTPIIRGRVSTNAR